MDELLKERDNIHSSFTVTKLASNSGTVNHPGNGSSSSSSNNRTPGEESNGDDEAADGKDKSGKKKWFNLNLKGSDKKLG